MRTPTSFMHVADKENTMHFAGNQRIMQKTLQPLVWIMLWEIIAPATHWVTWFVVTVSRDLLLSHVISPNWMEQLRWKVCFVQINKYEINLFALK